MRLDEASRGDKFVICELNVDGKMLYKLLDMGFVKGAVVEVLRVAPMLDPVELKIHNYLISLRKSEAALIEVKKYES